MPQRRRRAPMALAIGWRAKKRWGDWQGGVGGEFVRKAPNWWFGYFLSPKTAKQKHNMNDFLQ